MKKHELINLIKELPDDAEIVVNGYQDDILGDYQYEDCPVFAEDYAYLSENGAYHSTVSNYKSGNKVKVWILM